MGYISILLAIVVISILAITAFILRRVVNTNEVHIVQSSKKTTSYGSGTEHGNTYYEWPSWLPIIGVSKIVLPVSVFQIQLDNYDAYDKGRVPFLVDVVAFFRIEDSNLAAQRVASFRELQEQLIFITRGAVRTVLASHDIDNIMLERSTFGELFTQAVEGQLQQWGVITVKNIELMDIRDAAQNKVVHNIMEKKKSMIEMQSRTEVAHNMQQAQIAEINAQQAVAVQQQEAQQVVGQRQAETQKQVGIAGQQAQQEIKEQERLTKEKEMNVVSVGAVRSADITRQTKVIDAEQVKAVTVLTAEGNLEATKRLSEGIQVQGAAKAEAERLMLLAPVSTQIALAKEIGENQGYQHYLVTIKQVEAAQTVGIEQAKNLGHAEIKIIANAGNVQSGVETALDLFSSKGGTQLGAALDAFTNTDAGKAVMGRLTNGAEKHP